ncbi:hypothetical protein HZC20_02200, partial [Candidatus Peregrinibacteria bacterium]|nr:hypothetical protein [Candidatus Peregrinibacteria bacterium]
MLKFLKWFFCLFSKYVNSFERRVDKFFTHIKSTDHLSDIREDLLKLMQGNLIVLNVWLEKKFKGYTYLSKKVRRRMYENSDLIKSEFLKFYGEFSLDNESIRKDLNSKGLLYPNGDDEKIKYIACIQEFLSPGKYYEYIQTSSFGKLLNDPSKEKLQGDCNQIVTLYIYLYSLKYSISDLNIKLLPEHVCLHFRGIDIEATNGTFAKHTESRDVLPVTEIISTNLLDLTDFREEVQEISPQMIVKSAQLAYAISSLKSFVAKNLDIAYHNLGVNALNENNFESAIFKKKK